MEPTSKHPRRKRTPSTDSAEPAEAGADRGPSFEEALAALAEVVEQLEQGELGLSDSLARYEQGVRHLNRCYRELEAAERRVELLKGIDPQGRPITESFDEGAMSLEEKAAARGARRSADRPAPNRPRAIADDDLDIG
jgi:exodeoxyribonuclease VII small subunit